MVKTDGRIWYFVHWARGPKGNVMHPRGNLQSAAMTR